MEAVLEHHSRLAPAYDDCQGDVVRALKYIEDRKAEYDIDK